jgi:hypothetical protein
MNMKTMILNGFSKYTKPKTNYHDKNMPKFNLKHKNMKIKQKHEVHKTKMQIKVYCDNI